MKSRPKIRIIKKAEKAVERESRQSRKDVGRQSARKIVDNVSNWVNDLQKRKRAETKEAIDKLFPAKPQTDSA